MDLTLDNKDSSGRYAIVAACYYDDIINGLIDGCRKTLKAAGVDEKRIDLIRVPGALELPLAARILADKEQHVAIIALGAVIKGDTSHYDVVVNESCHQLLAVSVDAGIPVLNAVLTVYKREDAEKRCQDNDNNKGSEAATAALQMANLIKKLGSTQGE